MKYFDHSVTQPGLVAQLVEQRCSNQEVVGSTPAGSRIFLLSWFSFLISSFKACGLGKIMEGSIAHFLALIHTLYIIILLHAGPAEGTKLHARKNFCVFYPIELKLCTMIELFIPNNRIVFVFSF